MGQLEGQVEVARGGVKPQRKSLASSCQPWNSRSSFLDFVGSLINLIKRDFT